MFIGGDNKVSYIYIYKIVYSYSMANGLSYIYNITYAALSTMNHVRGHGSMFKEASF